MSVLVKNERSEPWIFESSRNAKHLPSGEVTLISDEEWDSIPFSKRGVGQMNALWPNENVSSDVALMNLDYYVVSAINEVRYIGFAPQGSASSASVWTIKRFSHTTLGGENYVSNIQVLEGVVWDDRATLPWS